MNEVNKNIGEWELQVRDYIKNKIEKDGLVGLHVNLHPDYQFGEKEIGRECFFEEFMRMVNSPTVPDPEILGKYSL